MSNLSLCHLLSEPSLSPALRPVYPKLLVGAMLAVLSGLFSLSAVWGMVQLIGQLSSQWVILSVMFWVFAAVLAALSSWSMHEAELGFLHVYVVKWPITKLFANYVTFKTR